ncbi:MAG TPA: glycerol-3-phosphate dehydrogenase C-terminal domain-containing protein, partial [Steroidobacteraceae bacterium]|nr:glycerol-3-phosphate dehydrogenase C-terminal domain-containing protein [Steroidobacteraceae bacterium]
GGDLPRDSFAVFLRLLARRHPWLPLELRERYARAYGTRALKLLGAAQGLADLGEEVLAGLYERELEYLRDAEWARTAQDILWRRTRLGLHLPAGAEAHLSAWLQRQLRTAGTAGTAGTA